MKSRNYKLLILTQFLNLIFTDTMLVTALLLTGLVSSVLSAEALQTTSNELESEKNHAGQNSLESVITESLAKTVIRGEWREAKTLYQNYTSLNKKKMLQQVITIVYSKKEKRLVKAITCAFLEDSDEESILGGLNFVFDQMEENGHAESAAILYLQFLISKAIEGRVVKLPTLRLRNEWIALQEEVEEFIEPAIELMEGHLHERVNIFFLPRLLQHDSNLDLFAVFKTFNHFSRDEYKTMAAEEFLTRIQKFHPNDIDEILALGLWTKNNIQQATFKNTTVQMLTKFQAVYDQLGNSSEKYLNEKFTECNISTKNGFDEKIETIMFLFPELAEGKYQGRNEVVLEIIKSLEKLKPQTCSHLGIRMKSAEHMNSILGLVYFSGILNMDLKMEEKNFYDVDRNSLIAELKKVAPPFIQGLLLRDSTNCSEEMEETCEFDQLVADTLEKDLEHKSFLRSKFVFTTLHGDLSKRFIPRIVNKLYSSENVSVSALNLIDFLALVAPKNLCLFVESLYSEMDRNNQTETFEAFIFYVTTSYVVNNYPGNIIGETHKCRKVIEKLSNFVNKSDLDFTKEMFSTEWNPIKHKINSSEVLPYIMFPFAVQKYYRGNAGETKKLIAAAKSLNSSAAVCATLKALNAEKKKYGTFESTKELFDKEHDDDLYCTMVKLSFGAAVWTYKNDTSCTVTNKATRQFLAVVRTSDNKTALIGAEEDSNDQDRWRVEINDDGLVSFQSIRYPGIFLSSRGTKATLADRIRDDPFLWRVVLAEDRRHVKIFKAHEGNTRIFTFLIYQKL